jgi:transglutaminase superfamily protein/transglutaminase TgpA-like protein
VARAARTLLVSLAPAAVVAVAWLRVEQPRGDLGRTAAVVGLALAPGLVRPLPARIVAVLATAVLAAWTAFGISPLGARPDGHDAFFGAVTSRFGDGFLAFYDVRLPFDPRLHQDMASVVLAAVFAFVLAVALAVAARRPVTATLLLLVGAGWPATLLGPSRALAVGAAILLASLALLAGLTLRRVPRAVVPAAAVLALLALAASGSPAVAKRGVVAWQGWDPYTRPPAPVSVSFVWNSQYLGLRWPRKRTTVLEVQAPQTASLYWRAAVLDDFLSSGWEQGTGRPSDSLEPPAASQRRNQTEQVVTVKALADTRLVGGSVPVRFDAGGADLSQPFPGFAYLMSGLPRGFRYHVWSYAPQPTAAALARSRPEYPDLLVHDGLFDVYPGVTMPEFGTRDRAVLASRQLARHPQVAVFRPLAHLAEEVGGGARTPYGAASALQRWFRSTGGFRYADTVHTLFPNPLVGFVTQTRAGYCQYFAGAMALMLRYLGVPARVAVGFSSGTYDVHRHVWVVTDHDAHAWVEAWFAGYGWLPFDPPPPGGRPERGLLSAGYAAPSGPGTGGGTQGSTGGEAAGQTGHRHGEEGPGVRPAALRTFRVGEPASHSLRDAVLFLLAVVLGAGVGGVALTKLALRRMRYLGGDPRRLAAACRRELADYLVDQRIEAARSATLHELGALVRRELAVDPDRFVAAATAARFGRLEGAAAAAREARRELHALVRAVRGRLTGRERLLGLVSLRSLGLSSRAEVDASA